MTNNYLEQGIKDRYNQWGMREPLIGNGESHMQAVQRAMVKNLSSYAKSYLYANSITGAKGLEFVAFSKSKLSRPVQLPNSVILFPCFIETVGKDVREPMVQASMHMEMSGTYIYDGWLPISSTDIPEIENRLEDLRESLSSFALISGGSFSWEPKYSFGGNKTSSYFLEEDDLGTLEDIAQKLGDISTSDKHAILRSVSWISRAQGAQDDCSKFLFSVLAIESLCNYIEQEAEEGSSLKQFAGPAKTKEVRREERENGIKKTIAELLDTNPTEAIREAYFTWVVPIKSRLRDHLKRVMGEEDEGCRLFFSGDQESETPALYDIRHLIAHGGMSTIRESDLLQVAKNVWNIEKFALRYVWRMLNTCLDVFNRRSQMTASIKMDLTNGILSSRRMYEGPVEMAILYYNRV